MESYEDKDILLLASSVEDLNMMWTTLSSVDPGLEERITGEVECEEALKKIVTSEFPIKFICPRKELEECITKCIYNLFLKNTDSGDIKVVLEENFPIDISLNKIILFDFKKRLVKIRKDHFTHEQYRKAIIHTLFDIPPVYISYGNDDDTKIVLNEIVEKFKLLFPHIKIKFDKKDVGYKRSITTYVESLKQGENIILLINRKYLESVYAMEELISLSKDNNDSNELKQKIYPIVTESGECIYDAVEIQKILVFWNKERVRILDAMKSGPNTALRAQLDIIEQIIKLLPDITKAIQDFYHLGLETYRESNFFDLFWEINRKFTKDGFVSFYSNECEMQEALEFAGKNQ